MACFQHILITLSPTRWNIDGLVYVQQREMLAYSYEKGEAAILGREAYPARDRGEWMFSEEGEEDSLCRH